MGKESISKSTFAKGIASAALVAASLGILTVGEYTIKNAPKEPGASSTETEAAAEASAAGTAAAEALSEPVSEAVSEASAETESPAAASVADIPEAQTETANSPETEAETFQYMDPAVYEAFSVSPEGPFTAGSYTASAAGLSSDVVVTMEFDEDSILSMDIDVSGESHGRGGLIDTELVNRILAAQTSEVDGVSGATVTSDAILSAAADCIAQANAGNTAYMEPETYAAVSESPEAPFTAGTYSASAAGISSDVVVTMEFDENSILSLDADVSGESHGRGSLIDTELTKRILAAQTSEVDGVSGATVTSDAILSAAADCIAQAQGKDAAGANVSESETAEAETQLLTPSELASAETELETEPESELLTAAELAAFAD